MKKILFVFLGSLILSVAGAYFATSGMVASPIWFASGFGFFSVTVYGPQYALALLLASFVKNQVYDASVGVSLIVAVGVALEALCARFIFIEVLKKRSVLIFHNRMVAVVSAAFLASIISATLGVSAHKSENLTPLTEFFQGWLIWYSGDVIGNLLFFPLLMSLRLIFRHQIKMMWEAFGYIVFSVLTVSLLVLYFEKISILLIILPFVVGGFLRYGATTALFLANFSAIVCSVGLVMRVGPFGDGGDMASLISMIFFLLTLALTVLVLIGFTQAHVLKQNLSYLFLTWLLAFTAAFVWEQISLHNNIRHFSTLTATVRRHIEDRLRDYEKALRGAAAFYQASDNVTKMKWAKFSEEFDISSMLPGVLGLGFVQVINNDELDKVLQEFRQQGVNIKAIQAIDKARKLQMPDHFIVKYLEPESINASVIGLDIGSERSRREAAEYGRDSGQASLISNVPLLRDVHKRSGFVFLIPIYQGFTKYNSVEERRKNHIGWTIAPFAIQDFISSALFTELKELHVEFYDNSDGSLLYSSVPQIFHRHENEKMKDEIAVSLAQRKYTIKVHAGEGFVGLKTYMPMIISSIIIGLGFLIALVMVNLQLTNRRISQQVKAKTTELIHAQQVAEAHREKSIEASRLASLGEMAGGIAHEINNPLSIILAKVFNLKSRLQKGKINQQEVLDYISKIEQTSYRIANIVKGMRSLSHDGSKHDFQVYSLKRITEDVLDVCREKFKNKGIELIVDTQDNLMVKCRTTQVAQVLINLLNNSEHAIENTPNPWVQIKTFANDYSVGIEVVDSGQGISKDIKVRMMQPFFTTKEVGMGTGLGLSIANRIMKEHSGSLEYDPSRANTTFIVRFARISV